MKKLLFCALIAFASCQLATAQERGDMYVGGIIGVSTSSISSEGSSVTTTNFSMAPEFGYFVADRLRISGSLNYGLSSSDGFTTHTLVIGPSIAYYVKLCNNFYYTPEFGLGFAYGSTEGISGTGVALGFQFGAFEFRPTSHWGLSCNLLSLDYTYLSYDRDISSSGIGFQLGISPTIGLKYYF